MRYEDTIWQGGYRAGKQDGLSEAEKLAFALQEVLIIASETDADPEWIVDQVALTADNYLSKFRRAKELEGKATGEDFPQKG